MSSGKKRSAMAGTWTVFAMFTTALFVGTVLVPQGIVYFLPQLSLLFSNPAANINLVFFSFNIIGFLITSAITLPLLVIILRHGAHTTSVAAG